MSAYWLLRRATMAGAQGLELPSYWSSRALKNGGGGMVLPVESCTLRTATMYRPWSWSRTTGWTSRERWVGSLGCWSTSEKCGTSLPELASRRRVGDAAASTELEMWLA